MIWQRTQSFLSVCNSASTRLDMKSFYSGGTNQDCGHLKMLDPLGITFSSVLLGVLKMIIDFPNDITSKFK